jgi:hypothetical protein
MNSNMRNLAAAGALVVGVFAGVVPTAFAGSQTHVSTTVTRTCESKQETHTVYAHKVKGVYVSYPTPKVTHKNSPYKCTTATHVYYSKAG